MTSACWWRWRAARRWQPSTAASLDDCRTKVSHIHHHLADGPHSSLFSSNEMCCFHVLLQSPSVSSGTEFSVCFRALKTKDLFSRTSSGSSRPPAGDCLRRQQRRHAAISQPQSEAADMNQSFLLIDNCSKIGISDISGFCDNLFKKNYFRSYFVVPLIMTIAQMMMTVF